VIHTSKLADERRECGALECWLLHGAVGSASDWRSFAARMAGRKLGTRAVDLWRFLDCAPMSLSGFGTALNADVQGSSGKKPRVLIGYSMGGRLALHALLENDPPWHAAVIISAHPGLTTETERASRRERDATWASRALTDTWVSFLHDWHGQPVLQGPAMRDAQGDSRLALRRREIARSFMDWSLGAQESLWERLPEIKIPVLWVAGEQDESYVSIAHQAAAVMPDARVAIAPASGHRVPWQAESWLVDQVAGFIS
jgi:2-succinyl-6-hydroxy-2,4-cyclohexadiene-1-carboxylate synthase